MKNVSPLAAFACALVGVVVGSFLAGGRSAAPAVAQPVPVATGQDEHKIHVVGYEELANSGRSVTTFRDGAGRTFVLVTGERHAAIVEKSRVR